MITNKLPGSCSIGASMKDTGTLGWTEGMSHSEAAQECMQTQKSLHDVTECSQNAHI